MHYANFRRAEEGRIVKSAPPVKGGAAASDWVEEKLGFRPDPMQRRLLDTNSRRVLLNCTRQWANRRPRRPRRCTRPYTKPESLTLVVSPSGRQSGEFLRKAAHFARKLGVRVKGDGDNEISLAFPNGSRLVGVPGNEATVRGFSAVRLLLVDEASRVSEGTLRSGPTDAGGERRSALAAEHAGGEAGILLRSVGARRAGVGAGAGAGDGMSADRPPHSLESERRTMGDRYFRQEFLCEFVATECAVFDRDLIERAFTDAFEPLRFD